MKADILIVDDEKAVRTLIKRILEQQGYNCSEAANAKDARDSLQQKPYHLLISDMNMPGETGLDLVRDVSPRYRDMAIIMVTGVDDILVAETLLHLGVYDYIIKPFDRNGLLISVANALRRRELEISNRDHRENLEQMVLERTNELQKAFSKIKESSLDTIIRLSKAAEYKDEDTGAHLKRISNYAATIARKLGLNENRVESLLYAVPMHDIGKIGIPDQILLKAGKLDDTEWNIMKMHTEIGAQILAGSDSGEMQLGEIIARTHHEKWDGSGYPNGLKGEEIPIEGRITAIVDVFDALTFDRPYRKALPVKECCAIIKKERGKHFDPQIIEAFFEAEKEILTIKSKYKDEDESKLILMTSS